MILVTGTKRSGTSMWMQILRDAGVPIFGEAFPSRWKETIAEANSEGFYESRFRFGIYYKSNPDPKTGEYLSPEALRGHAAKVFVPGLIRTDLAYIERVLVTVRSARGYAASIERLYRIEHENRNRLDGIARPFPAYVPPVIEWWSDLYTAIREMLVRGHAAHFVAYESVLEDPEPVVREVIAWLGVGDAEAAFRTARRELQTQSSPPLLVLPGYVTPAHVEVFDELYRRVHQRVGIDGDFIDVMNATHEALEPHIELERTRAAETNRLQMEAERAARDVSSP